MPKSLGDFKGPQPIFIDANIFLFHAFDTNNGAVEFLKKIETEGLKAFTSSLVLEEVFFKLLLQSASNFSKTLTIQTAKTLLSNSLKRKEVLAPVILYATYIEHLSEFGLSVLDLTGEDLRAALALTAEHGLITADAAHLAVMKRMQIVHLASGDPDFGDVSSITLWSPWNHTVS
jgi:predicted nucleic acid-binding protein